MIPAVVRGPDGALHATFVHDTRPDTRRATIERLERENARLRAALDAAGGKTPATEGRNAKS